MSAHDHFRGHWQVPSSRLGGSGSVVAYGSYGRPFVVFPSEQGSAWDFADNGMVDAVDGLLAGGRVKLYCVDSHDATSWSDRSKSAEERARSHLDYEAWLTDDVIPAIWGDCGGRLDVGTIGCSMGAFHALLLALRKADYVDRSLSLSGSYDPSHWQSWGDRGTDAYFTNPTDFVPRLEGGHLDWLRSRLWLTLVVGQGRWEDTTGALPSTRHMAGLLQEQGLHCDLDVWGHDVPHDWPSWRNQLAHHLPRLA